MSRIYAFHDTSLASCYFVFSDLVAPAMIAVVLRHAMPMILALQRATLCTTGQYI